MLTTAYFSAQIFIFEYRESGEMSVLYGTQTNFIPLPNILGYYLVGQLWSSLGFVWPAFKVPLFYLGQIFAGTAYYQFFVTARMVASNKRAIVSPLQCCHYFSKVERPSICPKSCLFVFLTFFGAFVFHFALTPTRSAALSQPRGFSWRASYWLWHGYASTRTFLRN